jgi:hypothetical protein
MRKVCHSVDCWMVNNVLGLVLDILNMWEFKVTTTTTG